MINIKLIDKSIYNLELDSDDLKNHFSDRKNCTLEILHQFNDLNYYDNFISKDDNIILDIGGNIGLFSIHVSPYAKKIITLEPTPSHFKLLTKITAKFNNIIPMNIALSNKSGTERFFTCQTNSTMNSLINRGHVYFDVESISLKDLIIKNDLNKIDFIKLDIEGSEVIALNEEVIAFISDKVKKILIETHDVGDGLGYGHRERFGEMFKNNGYKINYFGPDGVFAYK